MLRESLREGKAGFETVINQPDQRLAEVRLRLGLRIALGDRVQIVVDREKTPRLGVTLDAMWDSLEKKSKRHERGWVPLGHCQATVPATAAACKAFRGPVRVRGGPMSGRPAAIPADIWNAYDDVLAGREGWEQRFTSWGATIAVMAARDQPTVDRFAQIGWRSVYSDVDGSILVAPGR